MYNLIEVKVYIIHKVIKKFKRGDIMSIIALGFFFILLSLLISIVFYVLFAYALYTMAVNRSLENPWIAFIPFIQLYILGKLIKSLSILDYDIPSIELVLPVAATLVILLNRIPIIGSLFSLANYILVLFALNKLYKLYKPDQATLYTILSIFGLPIPFILMSLKNITPTEI